MDSWEDQVRRLMLDEEEGDNKLFLAVPQLCLYDEKMPEHTASLSRGRKGERNFRRSS